MTKSEKERLRRRQAIEPTIGHLKADHRLDRCWLKGAEGDALHTVLCAAGYNLSWLMRAVRRLGLRGLSAVLTRVLGLWLSAGISRPMGRNWPQVRSETGGIGFCRADTVVGFDHGNFLARGFRARLGFELSVRLF